MGFKDNPLFAATFQKGENTKREMNGQRPNTVNEEEERKSERRFQQEAITWTQQIQEGKRYRIRHTQ